MADTSGMCSALKTLAIRRFSVPAALAMLVIAAFAHAPEAIAQPQGGNNICANYKQQVAETKKEDGPVGTSLKNCRELIKVMLGDGARKPGLQKRMQDLDAEIAKAMRDVKRLEELVKRPNAMPTLQRQLAGLQAEAQKIGDKVLEMIREVTHARDQARKPNASISAAITKNDSDIRDAHAKAEGFARQINEHTTRGNALVTELKSPLLAANLRQQKEAELNRIRQLVHEHGALQQGYRIEKQRFEDSQKARQDHLQAMGVNVSLHNAFQRARAALDKKTKPNVPGSIMISPATEAELAKIRSVEGQTTITGLRPDGTPSPTGTEPTTSTGTRADAKLPDGSLTHPVNEAITEHERMVAAHVNKHELEQETEAERKRRAERGNEVIGASWGERTDYTKAMYTQCTLEPDSPACGAQRFGFRSDRGALENILEGSITANQARLDAIRADTRTPEQLRDAALVPARELVRLEREYNGFGAFDAKNPPEEVQRNRAEYERIRKELLARDPLVHNLIFHPGTDRGTYDAKDPRLMGEYGATTGYYIFQDGLNQKIDRPVNEMGEPTGEVINRSRSVTQAQDLVNWLESPDALAAPSAGRDAARRCSGSCHDSSSDWMLPAEARPAEVTVPTSRSLAERKLEMEQGIQQHVEEMTALRSRIPEAYEADRIEREKHDKYLNGCVQTVACAARLSRQGGYDYMRDGPSSSGWMPTWLAGNNVDNVNRLIVGKDPHAAGAYMAWVERNGDTTPSVFLAGDQYTTLNNGQRAVIKGLDDNFKLELAKAPLTLTAAFPVYDSYVWRDQMNAQAATYGTTQSISGLTNATFDYYTNAYAAVPTAALTATTGGVLTGGLIAGKGALTNMDSVPVLFNRGMAAWSTRQADNAFLGVADLYQPPAKALAHVYDVPISHVEPAPVVRAVEPVASDYATVRPMLDAPILKTDSVPEPLVAARQDPVVAQEVRPVVETPVVVKADVVEPVRVVSRVDEVEEIRSYPVGRVERSDLPPIEVKPEPVRVVSRVDDVEEVRPHPVGRVERRDLPPPEEVKPEPVRVVRDDFPRYEPPRYEAPPQDPPRAVQVADEPYRAPAAAQAFEPPPNFASLMPSQGAGQGAQQVAPVVPVAPRAVQPTLTHAANDISRQAAKVTDSGRVATPLRANDAPVSVASRTGQGAEELAPRGGTAPVSHAPAEQVPVSSGLGPRVASPGEVRATTEAVQLAPARAQAPATTASRAPAASSGWGSSLREAISRTFSRDPAPVAAEHLVNPAGGPRNFFQRVSDSVFGRPDPAPARVAEAPAASRASHATGVAQKAPAPKVLGREAAIDDYWQALHTEQRAGRAGADHVAAAEARLRDAHNYSAEALSAVKAALLKVQPEPALAAKVTEQAAQLRPTVDSYWRALHAGTAGKARVAAAEEALKKQGLGADDIAGLRGRLEVMPAREAIRSQAGLRELENVWKAMEASRADGEKVARLSGALRAAHKLDPAALDSAVLAMRETDSAAEAIARLSGEGGELSPALKKDLTELHRAVREQAAAQGKLVDAAANRLASAAKLDEAALAHVKAELAGARSLADVASVAARTGADEIGNEAARLTREALLNKDGAKELVSVTTRGVRRTLEGISDPALASPEQLEKAIRGLQKLGLSEADASKLAHGFHGTGRSADEAALSARRFAEEAVLARSASRAFHPPARLVAAERRAMELEAKLAARKEYEAAGGWLGKTRASYNSWKLGNEEKGILRQMNALRDAAARGPSGALAGEYAGRKWPTVIAKAERKAIASFISDTPGRGANAASKLADTERFLAGLSSKAMIVASNDPVVLRAAKAKGFRTIGMFSEGDWLAHGQRASQAGKKYWDGLCDYCMGRAHWKPLVGKDVPHEEAWRSLSEASTLVRYHGSSPELGRHASAYLRDYWFKANAVAKFTFSALDEAFELGRRPDENFTSQLRNAFGSRLKGYAAVEDAAAQAAAQRRAALAATRKGAPGADDQLAESAAYLLARHVQEGTPSAEVISTLTSFGYKEAAVKTALGLAETDQAAALQRLRHLPEGARKAVAGDVTGDAASLRQYAQLLKGGREVDGVDVVTAMKQMSEDLTRVGNEQSAAAYDRAVTRAMAAARANQVGENLRMSVADLERGLREVRSGRPGLSDVDALAALEKRIAERNPGRKPFAFVEEGRPSGLGQLILEGKGAAADLTVTAGGVKGADNLLGLASREDGGYRVQVFRGAADGEIGGRGSALHELWHVRNMRLRAQLDDLYRESRAGADEAAKLSARKKLISATLGNVQLKGGLDGLGASDLERLRQAAYGSREALSYQKDTGRAVLKSTDAAGRQLVYEARFAKGLSTDDAAVAMQRAIDNEAERVSSIDSYAYSRALDEKEANFFSAYGELRDGAAIANVPHSRGQAVEARARLAYARRLGHYAERITRQDIEDLSALKRSLADGRAELEVQESGLVKVTGVREDGSLVHLEADLPRGLAKAAAVSHLTESLDAGLKLAQDSLKENGRLALFQRRVAAVAASLERAPDAGSTRLASAPSGGRAHASEAVRELGKLERERDAFHLAAARRAFLANPESEATARAYDRAVKRHGHAATGALTSDSGLTGTGRLSRALEEEADFLAARAATATSDEAKRLRGALGAVRARAAGIALEQAATRSQASARESLRRGMTGVKAELRQSFQRNARHFGDLDFDAVMRDPNHRRALSDFLAADKIHDSAKARGHVGLRQLVAEVLKDAGDSAPAPAKVARMTRDLGALHARPAFDSGEAETLLRAKGWSDGEVRACRTSGLCENMRAHLAKDQISAPAIAREAELEARVPGHELRVQPPANPENAYRQLEDGLAARRKALAEELEAAPDAARKAATGRELASAEERLARLKDPGHSARVKELLKRESGSSLHGALVHPRTGEISAMGEELLKNPARKVAKEALVQPADGSAALVKVRDLLTAKGPTDLTALFERAGLDSGRAKALGAHSLRGAGDLSGAEIYGRLRALAKDVAALPAEQRFQVVRALQGGATPDPAKLDGMKAAFLDADRALAGSDPFSAGSAEQRVGDAILADGKAWSKEDIALCRAVAACGFDAYSPKEVLARAADARATAHAEAATAQGPARAPASAALANVAERRAYLEKKLDQIDAPWLKGELRDDFLRQADRVELDSSAAKLDKLAAALEEAGRNMDVREIFLARYKNAAELMRADAKLSREAALERGLDRVLQDVNGGTLSREALEAERRNLLACLQSLRLG